jgi:hypothetical protein
VPERHLHSRGHDPAGGAVGSQAHRGLSNAD